MQASVRLMLLLCAILTAIACHKPHDNLAPPPPPPAPQADSLGAWQKLKDSTTPDKQLIDIWFVSPTKGFYIGGENRIYQTGDGGITWTPIAGTTPPSRLQNLFFVNDVNGYAQALGHLLVSRDGGATWNLKNLPTTNNIHIFFSSPAIGFSDDGTAGLFKTTDSGTTWKKVRSDPTGGTVPYFFSDTHGIVVVGSLGKVDTTQSGGLSWLTIGQTNSPSAQTFTTLRFVDSLHGFYSCPKGLVKTVDGGVNWTTSRAGGGDIIDLVQFPDLSNGFFSADSTLYKTADGGASWTISARLHGGDLFLGLNFPDAHNGWACTAKGLILRLQQ